MPAPNKLYKCEGFSEDCWMENRCVVKSTFNPNHIWRQSRYVQDIVRARGVLKIKCAKDATIKEMKHCQ